MFAGYREFAIEPLGDGRTAFTHVEDVSGAVAPVFGVLMGRAAQQGHDQFNAALRTRVASQA